MEKYFIFNNIDSRNMGIGIGCLPPVVIPKKRNTSIVIEGRNGSLNETDNCYDSYLWNIECYMNDGKLENLATWLQGTGTLILSDRPDKIFYVKITNQIDLEQIATYWRNFTINFEVQPFNESVTEYEQTITQNGTFEVGGTVESQPIIEIVGTGDLSITLNNNTFHLYSIDGTVVIDSKLKMTIEDSTTVVKTNGHYPILKVGENTINIIGTYTSFKIKYRRVNLC